MTDSQTGEIILEDNQLLYIGIGFVVLIIILGIAKSKSKSSSDSYKDVERKRFTPNTKERVKELQHGKCAECGKFPTHWEFDHIDTRGENSIENCQGLCLDCHQSKTREDDWGNTRD
jgi:5-methylcytosine-specific restriction endonuclease McrA